MPAGRTGILAMLELKTYMCVICGFVYDEEKGLPEEGIEAGTRWRMYPQTGYARSVGQARKILTWLRFRLSLPIFEIPSTLINEAVNSVKWRTGGVYAKPRTRSVYAVGRNCTELLQPD
jgi:rubredoxin